MKLLFVVVSILFAFNAYCEPLLVTYPKGQSEIDVRRGEVVEIIRTALQKTEKEDGSFILEPSDYIANQLRQVDEIKSNKKDRINLAWMDTNDKIEADLLPIYIPIQKGIVGYRIFLIRKNAKSKFTKKMTLDDLRKLSNGIGLGWMDEGIFKFNKLNYIVGPRYEGLFAMLDAKRFDYYSRGINEAYPELKDRKKLYPDLRVEQNIALHYEHPIYLFTSRANIKLNERLETGLNLMLLDGSFDSIFCKYNKLSIDKANLKNRKIFKLKYHLTIPKSVIERTELWFDPMVDICQ